MATDPRLLSDDLLAEGIEALSTYYYETLAEHQGEVARFGDSWPGAQLQLQEMRQALSEYQAEWAYRHPRPETFTPADDPDFDLSDQGEPF